MDTAEEVVNLIFAEPTLTKRDLARYLRVCGRTIERLVARGELPPPLQVGRCLRWLPSDVGRFMTRSRQRQSRGG